MSTTIIRTALLALAAAATTANCFANRTLKAQGMQDIMPMPMPENQPSGHGIIAISAEQLQAEMASSKPMVVNVLGQEYAADCAIKGSVNIPIFDNEGSTQKFEQRFKKMKKNQRIIVHCASYDCPASGEAFKTLSKMGFTNVVAYEGGMREWVAKNLPRVGKCEQKYLRG